jgi:hypothetical protein
MVHYFRVSNSHRSALIDSYLDMVARDDSARFGYLLIDDCTSSLTTTRSLSVKAKRFACV